MSKVILDNFQGCPSSQLDTVIMDGLSFRGKLFSNHRALASGSVQIGFACNYYRLLFLHS